MSHSGHIHAQTHTSAVKLMFHVLTVRLSQRPLSNACCGWLNRVVYLSPHTHTHTHTHTQRLPLWSKGQGQMPHPNLGDRHPVPRVSYRVNQTSHGCHPSNWCTDNLSLSPSLHVPGALSGSLLSVPSWTPELMLYGELSSPDEIKQSHF